MTNGQLLALLVSLGVPLAAFAGGVLALHLRMSTMHIGLKDEIRHGDEGMRSEVLAEIRHVREAVEGTRREVATWSTSLKALAESQDATLRGVEKVHEAIQDAARRAKKAESNVFRPTVGGLDIDKQLETLHKKMSR